MKTGIAMMAAGLETEEFFAFQAGKGGAVDLPD
jgi:hypothetical protein